MARAGYFVISARVDPDIWEDFNQWYGNVHLPDATRRLGAAKAFRLHQRGAPYVHVAVYVLDDIVRVDTAEFQQELQALIAEFNAAWPKGVARERMFFELCT